MKRIKVSENFYLDEFIDPYTYFNTEDNGLSLIDKRLFCIAQLLRDYYGKSIRINNWWSYYKDKIKHLELKTVIELIEDNETLSKWSGIRTKRTDVGSVRSAHRKFKAIDPKGNAETFYNIVIENAKDFYELGLRRLEDIKLTPTWLHMDTLNRNTKPNSIRVVDLVRATKTIYFET